MCRYEANSQDRGFLDPSIQVVNLTFPPPTQLVPQPEASRIQIGRDWYRLSANMPAGTELCVFYRLRCRSLFADPSSFCTFAVPGASTCASSMLPRRSVKSRSWSVALADALAQLLIPVAVRRFLRRGQGPPVPCSPQAHRDGQRGASLPVHRHEQSLTCFTTPARHLRLSQPAQP